MASLSPQSSNRSAAPHQGMGVPPPLASMTEFYEWTHTYLPQPISVYFHSIPVTVNRHPPIGGDGLFYLSAGDSISVYPDSGMEFDADGNPVLMSLWFVTIWSFHAPSRCPGSTIWVKVKWLYCHCDLLTYTIAENELIRSDHTSLIDIGCIDSVQPVHHTMPARSRSAPLPMVVPFS
ncbi:hypothetical protein EDC04DRAFT_2601320 [Pisolithus marmoratus]|nr:hypothetical protein EDC04DRAFT_2601320 [Pisolithus marmoratus]